MLIRLLIISILLTFSSASFNAQQTCTVKNLAFKSGEQLDYKVVYNWGLIWLESAEASFKVGSGTYNNKKSYIFNGSGNTYPKHDWFFKVRDEFITVADSASFRPLKFTADIYEGSKRDKHTYLFDNQNRKVYTIVNRGSKKVTVDTLSINPCSTDVLAAIYYARNFDYSKCKPNDTIGISVIMDAEVFQLYIRYIGREKYTSKELGTFNCIKFKPLLVEGSIFKKGENMTVWVTDDKNKIPVYVETAIIVGSIKVSLSGYKGLRHPLDAKIKE